MKKCKYPRTVHLPYSEGTTNDDKKLSNTEHFQGKQVIVTIKMDGENSTLYKDGFHARSLDSSHHESQSWLKNFHNNIKHQMDERRICGENLYAKHAIQYNNLDSYFLGFSVWLNDTCLSWEDGISYMKDTGVIPVDIIYQGLYDEEFIKSLYNPGSNMEGFVVRLADSFKLEDFDISVAKFVRKDHVRSTKHWSTQSVIKNKLKN
jgi:hypothetical protein